MGMNMEIEKIVNWLNWRVGYKLNTRDLPYSVTIVDFKEMSKNKKEKILKFCRKHDLKAIYTGWFLKDLTIILR